MFCHNCVPWNKNICKTFTLVLCVCARKEKKTFPGEKNRQFVIVETLFYSFIFFYHDLYGQQRLCEKNKGKKKKTANKVIFKADLGRLIMKL